MKKKLNPSAIPLSSLRKSSLIKRVYGTSERKEITKKGMRLIIFGSASMVGQIIGDYSATGFKRKS